MASAQARAQRARRGLVRKARRYAIQSDPDWTTGATARGAGSRRLAARPRGAQRSSQRSGARARTNSPALVLPPAARLLCRAGWDSPGCGRGGALRLRADETAPAETGPFLTTYRVGDPARTGVGPARHSPASRESIQPEVESAFDPEKGGWSDDFRPSVFSLADVVHTGFNPKSAVAVLEFGPRAEARAEDHAHRADAAARADIRTGRN